LVVNYAAKGLVTMLFWFFILFGFGSPAAQAQNAQWSPPESIEWIYDVHGKAYDVVNVYLHGSLEEIQSTFINSGWTMATKGSFKNNFKYIGAVVFDGMDQGANLLVVGAEKTFGILIHHSIQAKNIPNPVQPIIDSMPVSTEVRAGNPSDFEFEMNNHPLGGREHFRVFNTHQVDANQRPVWAISASRDLKIKFDKTRPKQVFLNHEIEANEDLERDTFLKSLEEHVDLAVDVLQLTPLAPAPADGAYSADGRAYALTIASMSALGSPAFARSLPVLPAPAVPEITVLAPISPTNPANP
jgi:hypothetical protein